MAYFPLLLAALTSMPLRAEERRDYLTWGAMTNGMQARIEVLRIWPRSEPDKIFHEVDFQLLNVSTTTLWINLYAFLRQVTVKLETHDGTVLTSWGKSEDQQFIPTGEGPLPPPDDPSQFTSLKPHNILSKSFILESFLRSSGKWQLLPLTTGGLLLTAAWSPTTMLSYPPAVAKLRPWHGRLISNTLELTNLRGESVDNIPIGEYTPNSREAYLHWRNGIVEFENGRYSDAAVEWRLCSALDPSNSDCRSGLDRISKAKPALRR